MSGISINAREKNSKNISVFCNLHYAKLITQYFQTEKSKIKSLPQTFGIKLNRKIRNRLSILYYMFIHVIVFLNKC